MRQAIRWVVSLFLVLVGVASASAQTADLRVAVTSTSFGVGDEGVYRVSVRNASNSAATQPVRIVTTLPDGMTFQRGGDGEWTCNGGGRQVSCITNGIGAADTSAVEIHVYACSAAFPAVTTTFEVVYADDPNLSNNTATRATAVRDGVCSAPPATATRPRPQFTVTPTRTPTPSPRPAAGVDLSLTASSSRELMVGSRATYRFRITNLGESPTAESILFVDTLPPGLTFVSAVGDRWSCTAVAQVVTCERFRSLASGTRTGITLNVQVDAAAYPLVVNEAAIFFAGDADASNNLVTRSTSVRKPQRPAPRPRPER